MNIVHLIDCNEYMKDISDKHFDLAIVDPPYFDGPESKIYYGKCISSTGVGRFQKKSDCWDKVTLKYFDELLRISKHYVFWGANYNPFNFHSGRIVWNKVNGSSGFSDCEIAATDLFDHVRMFTYMWNGMLQGKSITDGKTQQGNKKKNEKRIHPTQKPVALYKWTLMNYAKPGYKIFDSHVGSGSHRIACFDMGFNFTGCEKDKTHWQSQELRFQNHIKQNNLFAPKELQESMLQKELI